MPAFWVDDTTLPSQNARGGRIHGNIHRCPGPGNHQLPGHPVQPGRARLCPAPSTPSARSTPSPAGWSTIRWKSGPRRRRALAEVVGAAHIDPKRIAALGHHQPAGDHHPLGPAPPGSRSATPSSGSAAGPLPSATQLKADGLGELRDGADGPADRRLFLRHQDPVAAGQRPRRPGTGGAGGAAASARWTAGSSGTSPAGQPT